MRKNGYSSLWASFVFSTFAAMTVSFFTVTWLIMMARRTGIIDFRVPFPLGLLLSFFVAGIILSAVMTLVLNRRIIDPLIKLREATREVARGNFEVRLDETAGISQVREMARDFNAMAGEISGIETLRNDFVANVSHEFKTPLASIEGYATLLRGEGLTDGDREEYTSFIIESSRKLSTLTANILKLSKLENQEIIPSREVFSLDEQLRRALLELEPQWSRKELELDIELEPVSYRGSEELLLQVWLNLIGNAIKFTPPKKRVSVSLIRRAGSVAVEIADEGIGISGQAQQHIFEKFYQVDKTRSSGGNGLGLALVKRIVSLCGGSVSVRSAEGEGSRFTVELPDSPE